MIKPKEKTDILLRSSCDSGKNSRRRITMRGLGAERRGRPRIKRGTGVNH